MPKNPFPITIKPPYIAHWGEGSYDVCPCCGFEFGLSEDQNKIGLSEDDRKKQDYITFEQYLKEWYLENEGTWFMPEKKPKNWSLQDQLKSVGLKLPEFNKLLS